MLTESPTYQLTDDIVITLKPVPPFLIHAISSSAKGKPVPPMQELKLGNKTRYEANYDDVHYQKALKEYEEDKNLRTMQLILTEGVKGRVSDYISESSQEYADIETLASFVYGNTYGEKELMYTWLTRTLVSDDAVGDFQEAIMSLTMPTEASLEDSKSGI